MPVPTTAIVRPPDSSVAWVRFGVDALREPGDHGHPILEVGSELLREPAGSAAALSSEACRVPTTATERASSRRSSPR